MVSPRTSRGTANATAAARSSSPYAVPGSTTISFAAATPQIWAFTPLTTIPSSRTSFTCR